jgi:hypothetical protein
MKEIVVAAYDRDLGWLKTINSDVKQTIYRKGVKTDNPNEIFIEPNLGRCVHSFFNHIYINYDNLADYTFFVQDYPFDHWGNLIEIINDDLDLLSQKASLTIGGYYGFHNNTLGTAWIMSKSKQFNNGFVLSCQSDGKPQDNNSKIDVDKYWNILFDEPKPNEYEFMPGGHFAITKTQIHLRSKELYKKIIDLLIEDVTSPWMIERLECYIFNLNYKTKF